MNVVNRAKYWLLSKTIDLSELQQRSLDSAQQIRRNLSVSSAQESADYCSWGQYADHSPKVDQSGIYGTSVAIQALYMMGDSSSPSKIKKGEQWLFNEWTSEDSRTTDKLDQAVVYKHVWCLNALGLSNADQSDDYFDSIAEELWNKRVGWGWGEYNYDIDRLSGDEAAEPMILPTALVLSALARSNQYSKTNKYEDSLSRVLTETSGRLRRYITKGIGDKQKLLLESAFVLIACYEYDKHSEAGINRFKNDVNSVGRNIVSLLENSEDTTPNTSVFHQYMMPRPEERRSRHISFILNPVVCLSIICLNKMNISTSGFEFRWRFILDNVIYYTSEILQSNGSDRGYYTRPHQGMVSNSDNYWIARFLYEFSSIEPDQLKISRLVLEELKSKIPVSVLFLFVFFTLAGVAGIITLNQELGTEVIAGILLAISSAVVAKFVEYIIPRIQG